MKILFSGGGTLGPVTPLLAMKDIVAAEEKEARFVWVGTHKGPERELIEQAGIPFHTIAAGKLRRYVSFWNIIDLGRIIVGFFQSLYLLWKVDPDICISAGGFVSVPLHWAAWLLGIPAWVHQQDIRVGLANRLMGRSARLITTAMEQSVSLFPKSKTTWLGNPVRNTLFDGTKKEAVNLFGIDPKLPVVFATGGGTGSMKVNQMVVQAAQSLEGKATIIHLTGKERPQDLIVPAARQFEAFYKPYQFFTHEMKHAYAAADIVISRAGFGTITEMAALKKAAILIPKPGHQDENAGLLEDHQAAIVLPEDTSDGNHLLKAIRELLEGTGERESLANNLHALLPPVTSERIMALIKQTIQS